MPVREEMTAAPPVNNIAVTRMLVMMPNTVKTLMKVRSDVHIPKSRVHGVLQMSGSSKPCPDNLKESVGIRSASLKLNGNAGKQQDLDSSSRSIPERPRDTVFVRNGGALQEGCSPCPGRHDGGSYET